jgi:hypothetical protein
VEEVPCQAKVSGRGVQAAQRLLNTCARARAGHWSTAQCGATSKLTLVLTALQRDGLLVALAAIVVEAGAARHAAEPPAASRRASRAELRRPGLCAWPLAMRHAGKAAQMAQLSWRTEATAE